MTRFVIPSTLALLAVLTTPTSAQSPLRVDITEGVATPLPIAIPDVAHVSPPARADEEDMGVALSRILRNDLLSTAFYRLVPSNQRSSEEQIVFAPFMQSGAQALVIGRVRAVEGGQLSYDCTLYDVFAGRIEASKPILVRTDQWRRAAHKCADMVFLATTGDPGHFDTRLLSITESDFAAGKAATLSISDYDGASARGLTQGRELVAMPAFAPDGERIVFMSYDTPVPGLVIMDVANGRTAKLNIPGGVVSSPAFSPDGTSVVFSLTRDGSANVFAVDIATGAIRQITDTIGSNTSPSFSPDGRSIAFESDRSGRQQIYVMGADGSGQRRISFGKGAYASPAWSPRGDEIAFTHIEGGRLRIGVMNADGSRQRFITDGPFDEDASWAASGRAIAYQRRSPDRPSAEVWITDLTGKARHIVRAGSHTSDPAWSGTRP